MIAKLKVYGLWIAAAIAALFYFAFSERRAARLKSEAKQHKDFFNGVDKAKQVEINIDKLNADTRRDKLRKYNK
jgi:beta-lactamase regulating signal transducer with metallopeptidase domain